MTSVVTLEQTCPFSSYTQQMCAVLHFQKHVIKVMTAHVWEHLGQTHQNPQTPGLECCKMRGRYDLEMLLAGDNRKIRLDITRTPFKGCACHCQAAA